MIPIESARAAFAGTPEFAVPSLKALIAAGVSIDCVFTQPDRRAGRGRRLTQSPVKQFAVSQGIPVFQPVVLDEQFRTGLPEQRPDILVVVAYGLILPQWMLDWPEIAPLNVHASLLPRWRGASPIQQAILSGDRETGVSVMRMTRGLDCGPVYQQQITSIDAAETAGQLHDRLAILGAELLVETLPGILAATLRPQPQDDDAASYAPRLEKSDAVLNWKLSALQLVQCVRGYDPWPVAEARTSAGDRLRVWQAQAIGRGSAAPPGTVVDVDTGVIDVATADGLLRIEKVQPPGGRVMTAQAYLAAHDLRGTLFVGPE